MPETQGPSKVKLLQSVVDNIAACKQLPEEHPNTSNVKFTVVASATNANQWLFSIELHQEGGKDIGASGVVAPM